MTENISSKHQNTQARFAFWSSVIMTVAGLVLSVYRVFLITASPVGDWRDYASLALTGSLCVMGLVSIWLSRRGRITLGISLLLGVFLVMLLLIPALQSGLGFLCGVCAFTITAAIAQQTFPARAAGRVTVTGGVTGVAALLIDLSWPLERLASSETLITLGIILASTTILIYSFIVVRQFTNYALGTKFALGFMVITLVAVASGFLSLNTYASVGTKSALLNKEAIPGLVHILETQATLAELRGEVEEMVLSGNASHREHADEAIAAIQEALAAHTALAVQISEEKGLVAQDMENRAASVIALAQTVMDAVGSVAGTQSEMDATLEQMSTEIRYLRAILKERAEEYEGKLAETKAEASQSLVAGIMMAWATMIVAVVLALGVGFFLTRAIVDPITTLTTAVKSIERGEMDVVAEVTSGDEIGVLARAFNSMTARLQSRTRDVEQRTRDAEQRSAYLEGSADISRAAASVLDPDALIRQVVELIKERFELYYVGLFLVDERNEWAVLQAGTGEAGRKMLARNHRLKIGEGMIGWSIANTEARIALDVGEDAVRFENPDLPETRSEGALPLRSRGRVLGALTVQSTAAAAFNPDILTTLQTMTDQIAVALDNAGLFAKSEAALEAERRAYGELSREAWAELSQSKAVPGYLVTAEGALHPIKGQQTSQETQAAIHTGQVIQDGGVTAVIPIKSHGHVLGGIKIRKGNANDTWTQEEIELVETLSEQISVALESARLYQDTQRRAAREQLTGEVTARMRETLDVDTILQTAVREIGDALGIDEVEVRMGRIAPIKNVTTEGDLP